MLVVYDEFMMNNIIVFENLRFRPPKRKRKADGFKNLHSGTVLKTCVFQCPNMPFTCGKKAKKEKTYGEFKLKRIRQMANVIFK